MLTAFLLVSWATAIVFIVGSQFVKQPVVLPGGLAVNVILLLAAVAYHVLAIVEVLGPMNAAGQTFGAFFAAIAAVSLFEQTRGRASGNPAASEAAQ